MESKNPFHFRELALDAPFCDRQKELRELTDYAKAQANVVLFSPRRYGKTSLVKRVQKKLAEEGYLTIFMDFFGVTSPDEVAYRMAKAIFEVTKDHEPLFKKLIGLIKSFRPILKPDESGVLSLTVEAASHSKTPLERIDDLFTSLSELTSKKDIPLHITFDEFQEMTELKEALPVEGIMRSHIQHQPISYFFVGSRRRLLLEMFNERKRPFFQSAINYEIPALPREDLITFLITQFESNGRVCPRAIAEHIVETTQQHPYYAQKFSFFVFEEAQQAIQKKDIQRGYEKLMAAEKPVFESILQGCSQQQIALLKALSAEPSPSLFSFDYTKRHHLTSTGAISGASKKLAELDYIEKTPEGTWQVVDPLFAQWLRLSP